MRFCSARSRRIRSLRSASLRFSLLRDAFPLPGALLPPFGLLRLCELLPPFEPLRLCGLPRPCVPLPSAALLRGVSALRPAAFLLQGVCALLRVFGALLPNVSLRLSDVLRPDESLRHGGLLPRRALLPDAFVRPGVPVPDALAPDAPARGVVVPVALVRVVLAPSAVAPASPARAFPEPDVPLAVAFPRQCVLLPNAWLLLPEDRAEARLRCLWVAAYRVSRELCLRHFLRKRPQAPKVRRRTTRVRFSTERR